MTFEWILKSEIPDGAMGFGSAITHLIEELVRDNFPELAIDAPTQSRADTEVYFADDWCACRVKFSKRHGMRLIGQLKGPDVITAEAVFRSNKSSSAFCEKLVPDWVERTVFTYIGPRQGEALCWPDVAMAVGTWFESIVLPEMIENNRRRVMRAIPAAPIYNLDDLQRAVWILESEKHSEQGTAFALDGIGLVTCNHCLREDTKAFHWSDTSKIFDVRILRSHERVDLAVLEGPTLEHRLTEGVPSDVRQTDHLMVLGHPNYRRGDTPMCSPGLVAGFRMFAAVRRFLTTASIVAGASGGPVVDAAGKVIGVAVCGSKTFETAAETEDHAVIPIDALELI